MDFSLGRIMLTFLVVVFALLRTSDTHPFINRGTFSPACLDVAIVGGGIGGTYSAWKLRDRGLKIAIFENTDRIGGRMLSIKLPSIPTVPVELGAMRYYAGSHTAIEKVISQLGLETKVFTPDNIFPMFYLRGTLLKPQELNSPKLPYNLAPDESKDLGELRWVLAQRALNNSNPDEIVDLQEATTSDGVPLYKQGYINIINEHLSSEAVEYMSHAIPWKSLFARNHNAVQGLIAPNVDKNFPRFERKTVVGGMNLVSQKLAENFTALSHSHSVSLNRRVDSITKIWDGNKFVYKLTMFETQTVDGLTTDKSATPYTVCADQVILALPPKAVRNIHWFPLTHDPMKSALESAGEAGAMKIFLVYPSAWWDSLAINNKSFVTDLPIRTCMEFGRYTNSSGHELALMLVSYADGNKEIAVWRQLREYPGQSISSSSIPRSYAVNAKVVEHVHRDLATVYNVSQSSLPWPIDGAMHIWDNPQNGGAWHVYEPGFKPKDVLKIIPKPSPFDKVFVVTNAFSTNLSTWAEGSVRAADEVLMKYFNVV